MATKTQIRWNQDNDEYWEIVRKSIGKYNGLISQTLEEFLGECSAIGGCYHPPGDLCGQQSLGILIMWYKATNGGKNRRHDSVLLSQGKTSVLEKLTGQELEILGKFAGELAEITGLSIVRDKNYCQKYVPIKNGVVTYKIAPKMWP